MEVASGGVGPRGPRAGLRAETGEYGACTPGGGGSGEPGGTEHAATFLKLNSNSGCLYVNKHTWPGAAMLASAEPAHGSTAGAER